MSEPVTPPEPAAPASSVKADTRRMAAEELRLVSVLVVIMGISLLMALPFVLSAGQVVFLPFVTAAILSVVLAPIADQLNRLGLPNLLSSFIAVIALIGIVVVALLLILQPAADMLERFPAMVAQVTEQFSRVRSNFDWVNDLNRLLSRLAGRGQVREVIVQTPSVLEQVAFATPSVVIEIILTLLMTFFMIESRDRLRKRVLHDRASLYRNRRAARIIRDVQARVGRYILTVAIINAGIGLVVAFGAWAIGLEAPIMWGGLAALLNFMPYIGPVIMIAALSLFGIGTSDTILVGLIPPAAYLALHTVEANLFTPSVLGVRFTLNPVLILLFISLGTWIWGVVGALLSVPILITLTALIEHIGRPNLVGFLFGEALFPRAFGVRRASS
ncbi:MAG: AI-2E family transporter [Novosphingobium sp.]